MLRLQLSRKHFLTYSPDGLRDTGKFRYLDAEAWEFLEPLADDDASHAVVATQDRKVVGFFRCTVVRGTLFAQGTWVAPTHRRQGLAKRLWLRALKALRPTAVSVDTMSEGGAALVGSLSVERPDLFT